MQILRHEENSPATGVRNALVLGSLFYGSLALILWLLFSR